jgi:hypothetical protein
MLTGRKPFESGDDLELTSKILSHRDRVRGEKARAAAATRGRSDGGARRPGGQRWTQRDAQEWWQSALPKK